LSMILAGVEATNVTGITVCGHVVTGRQIGLVPDTIDTVASKVVLAMTGVNTSSKYEKDTGVVADMFVTFTRYRIGVVHEVGGGEMRFFEIDTGGGGHATGSPVSVAST
jgi:hypothetical protein